MLIRVGAHQRGRLIRERGLIERLLIRGGAYQRGRLIRERLKREGAY